MVTKRSRRSRVADMEKVERIVEKMRKKYAAEGIEIAPGEYAELTSLIAEGKVGRLEVQKVEDLKESESKVVSFLGKTYLSLRAIMGPIHRMFANFPLARKLELELYSANMKFSARQWLALASVVALLCSIICFALLTILAVFAGLHPAFVLTISIGMFFFSALAMLLVPSQRAKSRGKAISAELPFALRHIATQLSAGIGLYRTLQAVAKADYGPLSEEFARTITEIEEGMDTQDALRRLALRTKSVALRNAMMHTIRAIKTGGNLSDVMNDIAEDVAFQLRTHMQEFGQKMNFIGVFFIFFAIVFPVFVAILGSIRNAPLSHGKMSFSFSMIPLDVNTMALIYLLVMPALLIWLFFFIRIMQPHA
ncbi:MAG: type II secretion system F family protein [Candidatus Diapherotrites archaeon]|nr:type II secretion system F family protein [Candidatus Diapherotrites archaeon]